MGGVGRQQSAWISAQILFYSACSGHLSGSDWFGHLSRSGWFGLELSSRQLATRVEGPSGCGWSSNGESCQKSIV